MSAFIEFDATNVNPNGGATIPAGSYNVIISSSEIKQTKSGNGSYLELTLVVQDGEFQGFDLQHRITLQNQSPKAVSIGQRHLSQICHAVGVLQIKDSAQLHNKPLIAVVTISKGKDGYPDSNEVARYEQAQGFAPVPSFQHSAPPIQPQPQAAAAPWAAGR